MRCYIVRIAAAERDSRAQKDDCTPESCALNGSGAGYKVRTRDPLITNQVLYQLS